MKKGPIKMSTLLPGRFHALSAARASRSMDSSAGSAVANEIQHCSLFLRVPLSGNNCYEFTAERKFLQVCDIKITPFTVGNKWLALSVA
jgi:hypothetical protein